MSQIYVEIEAERRMQDARWGGPEHDDEHTPLEWANFVERKLTAIRLAHIYPHEITRETWVKIAALAVAALESHDRKHPQ